MSYDLDTAEKKLNQYGIDYFANLRSKNEDDTDNVNDNEEDDDSDKQLELPFGDDDDDTEDYDEEEEEDEADDDISDDNNNADIVTSTSESQKQSLGDKTVKFFQANNIKDKNYVIWVVGIFSTRRYFDDTAYSRNIFSYIDTLGKVKVSKSNKKIFSRKSYQTICCEASI